MKAFLQKQGIIRSRKQKVKHKKQSKGSPMMRKTGRQVFKVTSQEWNKSLQNSKRAFSKKLETGRLSVKFDHVKKY